MPGCVHLVGAGPGDPGLLTLRGREVLGQADAVVYDYLASRRLLDFAPRTAERIYVGKQASAHTLSQDEINDLLVRLGRSGKTVVRLKGGDPFVFGRGGEEALALVEAGVPFEVVPGVTAGIAAAAYAGIPVTHRTLASNFGLVTGHETPDKEGSDLDFKALANWRGTLAFFMGVKNLGIICRSLVENGMSGRTPAAVVRWGCTPRQRVVTGTVSTIADVAARAGIKPPALIYVGQVVSLREKLNWFESRPLLGRRIVVTRAREQASQLTAELERLGAEVIELPTIRIEPPEDPTPLDRAVQELDAFDWIVLTSANGVAALLCAIDRAGGDSRSLARNRLCVVGPSTANRLAEFGLHPDAIPPTFKSADIVGALASEHDLHGVRILCPRADVAPRDLIDDLIARGAAVTDVVAYRTVPEDVAPEQLEDVFGDENVDWITFTSSSTVYNLVRAAGPDRLRACSAQLASIGPSTSETLRGFGFEPAVEAETHTIAGLVEAVLRADKTTKDHA